MRNQHLRAGFTIVELLIVIVVIAILAAITIVAYNGIRNRAVISSLSSDLSQAAKKIETIKITNGSSTYPTDPNSIGLPTTGATTYVYIGSATYYCLTATQSGVTYRVKSTNITPEAGDCSVIGVVTTLAGSTDGFADGSGTAARFSRPMGIAAASDGTLYVTDQNNYRIRKITPDGTVTTLAGAASAGTADGTGTAARFSYLNAITVGEDGNIYVSDRHAIRKITPSGVVTTLAGSIDSSGSDNGTGSTARFTYPGGMAVLADGTVYVADTSNHLIRKISSAGVVTTFAGSGVQGYLNGTGTATQFSFPYDITKAPDGNFYVSERRQVRKFTPAGVVSSFVGSSSPGFQDGNGAAASFHSPVSVALHPDGSLYIVDQAYSLLRKATPSADVTTLAGNYAGYADGTGTAALFNQMNGITIGADGSIYIADSENNRIRKIQ